MPLRKLIYALLLTSLVGCTTTREYPPTDTTNLESLQNMRRFHKKKDDKMPSTIRIEALKDTAMTIGAQGALALRSQQIDDILKKDTKHLDKTFNFSAMLLPNNVLPPVLTEGRHLLNLADEQTIRVADQTYLIVSQARFVTAPPTWRDYLWMDFSRPEAPDATLLPRNRFEHKYWAQFVAEGWRQGVEQANNIFAENVSRLERDYRGMALYRKLVDENMISTPYVATTSLGITGDGNQMTINDKVKRITSLPQLNPEVYSWRPAVAEPTTKTPDP
jgi:defect-in-organelle-trafficking protein DotC